MSEQLLDDPQVRAALEQMGRERVAQRVRADPAGRGPRGRPRRRRSRHACCRASRRPRSPTNSGPAADGLDVVGRRGARRADRRSRSRASPGRCRRPARAAPVALADDPHERAVEREVLAVEPERLADPQAGRVQQLEQRTVARAARRGGLEQPLHLVDVERVRQAADLARQVEMGRDIDVDEALAVGEPVETLQRRGAPSQAGRREGALVGAPRRVRLAR